MVPNLDGAFDPISGYPVQTDGVSDNHPGMYFVGLHWMSKWKRCATNQQSAPPTNHLSLPTSPHPSAILLGCGEDALHVATHIASRAESKAKQARHQWKVATATIIASHRLSNRVYSRSSHAQTAMEVVPASDGLSAAGADERQMTGDEAAALPFTCWLDQMPRLVSIRV